MMQWEKYSRDMISGRMAVAIDHNINYHTDAVLGFPGTHLDAEDYYADGTSALTQILWASSLLDDEPYLRTISRIPIISVAILLNARRPVSRARRSWNAKPWPSVPKRSCTLTN